MSWAPSISGMTKLASPANAGITNRKIISVACAEKSAVVGARREVLRARLGQLGAHAFGQRAADHEEEEGQHQVLDPDHLVVGVDPEVVLPAAGAVRGVILLDPVGAAADP